MSIWGEREFVGLSASEKLVWLFVETSSGDADRMKKVNEPLIAACAGISEPTVKKALRSLVDRGCILIDQEGWIISLSPLFNASLSVWRVTDWQAHRAPILRELKERFPHLLKAVTFSESTPEFQSYFPPDGAEPLRPDLEWREFWEEYPHRVPGGVGVAEAARLWKHIPLTRRAMVIEAVKGYKVYLKGDLTYARKPENFLRDNYWEGFVKHAPKFETAGRASERLEREIEKAKEANGEIF